MKWTMTLAVALLCVLVDAAWSPAHAQFGFIGEKLKEKAEEKTEEAIDEAVDGEAADEEAPAETTEGEDTGEAAAAGG